MKKLLPVILILVLMVAMTAVLVGCTDKDLTIVRYYADELKYKEGDTFKEADAKVTVVMSDGTERLAPTSPADVVKFEYSDDLKAILDKDNKFINITSTKIVELYYTFLDETGENGKTVTIKITVNPKN